MVQSGFFEQPRKIDLWNLQLFGEDTEKENIFKVVAFKLYNFKAFEDTDWIYINKLTLFLGDNSAGKSVLYQVVKLLKNCYELMTQGRYFSDLGNVKEIVGTFEDAHNKNSENECIVFSFLIENIMLPAQKFVYCVEIRPTGRHEYGIVSKVTLDRIGIGKEELLTFYDCQNLFFLRHKQNVSVPNGVAKDVMRVMDALRDFAEQIRAISCHRYIPERQMVFTGTPKEYVESNGENAYEMLIQLAGSAPEREQKINGWLNKFGYTYHWEAAERNVGEFMLVNERTGKKSNIVDNGLGISQSLPIAVELSDLKGNTILLDTPEAFLQTRMQSEMGDLLIEGAKTGNVLAETGSEYVVLRIQRRIAENIIDAKDVSLYFIYDNKENGSAVCQMLEVNPYGEFINVPKEFKFFFSSDYFDMQAMSKVKIEQMRKNQNAGGDRHEHMG